MTDHPHAQAAVASYFDNPQGSSSSSNDDTEMSSTSNQPAPPAPTATAGAYTLSGAPVEPLPAGWGTSPSGNSSGSVQSPLTSTFSQRALTDHPPTHRRRYAKPQLGHEHAQEPAPLHRRTARHWLPRPCLLQRGSLEQRRRRRRRRVRRVRQAWRRGRLGRRRRRGKGPFQLLHRRCKEVSKSRKSLPALPSLARYYKWTDQERDSLSLSHTPLRSGLSVENPDDARRRGGGGGVSDMLKNILQQARE